VKRNPVLLAALALSLLASGLLGYRWRQAEKQLQETVRWTHFVMDSLGTTVELPPPPLATGVRDSLYWQWVATTARLQSRRWQQAVRHWVDLRSTLLDELDIARLKEQGLEDPPRQLRKSLLDHPDLIPFPGVLGGTMEFRPDDAIILLWSPYVFARFDDGHEQGSLLAAYSVQPGGQIQWRRLWATLE